MTPALRIIDANANRAREALRVLEDIARFALNDAELSAALKHTRHDLTAALSQLPADRGAFLAWRDTPGDVGTSVSTPSEARRDTLGDVAAASCSRLSEALRSIEEAAKVIAGAPAPSPFERLRYAAYELERRVLAQTRASSAPRWRLCVLVTASACGGRSREDVAAAAIDGGADCIQLREKELNDAALLAAARSLRAVTRERATALVVNDRVDVALLADADGVHLGREDLEIRDARRLGGERLLVGVSTSNLAEVRAAIRSGADYVGIGPMFPTNTKRTPEIAGPAALGTILEDPAGGAVPHLAIGGISPENVAGLVAAGARGVAVCEAVCASPDPCAACRALRAAFSTRD